jgi:WD40 repeat protein
LNGRKLKITSTLDKKYAFIQYYNEFYSSIYFHAGQSYLTFSAKSDCDIFDIQNQQKIGYLDQVEDIKSIEITPDSTIILVLNREGNIFKLDIKDINNIKIVDKAISTTANSNLFVSPNGKQALNLNYSSGLLNMINITDWELMKNSLQLEKEIHSVAFINKGKLALAGYKNLNIINVENQEILKKIKLPNNIIISISSDKPIQINSDNNFALIKCDFKLFTVLDIEKQEFIGEPFQFIDSEGNIIKNLKFMTIPQEEETDFFNFQNYNLILNYKN